MTDAPYHAAEKIFALPSRNLFLVDLCVASNALLDGIALQLGTTSLAACKSDYIRESVSRTFGEVEQLLIMIEKRSPFEAVKVRARIRAVKLGSDTSSTPSPASSEKQPATNVISLFGTV